MPILPNLTVDAIYKSYQERIEPRRAYLGGSQIGEECARKLWYSFRWVGQESFDGRMLRLFDTGKREEDRIIADLRAIGCTVYDKDNNGNQWRFSACNGHLSCGFDCVVEKLPEAPETPHLCEIKTHNKKSYEALEKKGVKEAKPQHHSQMQIYMGLAELTRAAYIAVNKDSDDIYFERIEFDPKTFKALLLKAERIIYSESVPDRISEDPKFFKCAWCGFNELCHVKGNPEVNCRTCVHSSPADNGKWACALNLPMATDCIEHIFIPSILHWAEPIDGTPGYIVYKLPNGIKFINCAGTAFPAMDLPHYSSSEISAIQIAAIGHPVVEMARTILGGKIVRS